MNINYIKHKCGGGGLKLWDIESGLILFNFSAERYKVNIKFKKILIKTTTAVCSESE